MNGDRIHPNQRVNPYAESHWQAKLAACLFAAAVLLAIAVGCFASIDGRAAYRAVLCPPDWRATVSQRYDTRDRFDWIIKRTWIARCY